MKVKWGKQGTAVLATAVLVVGSLAPVSASGETTKSDKTIQNVKIDHVKVKDIYEAEDAQLFGSAKVNTDHKGYSGSGFVDSLGNEGSAVKFTINAKKEGRHTLSLRYCSGYNGDAATLNLYVNGKKTEMIGLAALEDWDTWWNRNCTVDLKKGENTIEIKREGDNANATNLDYITLEEADWTYIGACTKVEGSGTSELTFQCQNAAVKVKACDNQIIKVWCEPSGKFYRRYESFAVVDEDINPVNLDVEDKGAYYEFSTEKLTIRVNKAQFSMTYLDKEGNVLCENQAEGIGMIRMN